MKLLVIFLCLVGSMWWRRPSNPHPRRSRLFAKFWSTQSKRRSHLKSGAIICLRRPKSCYPALPVDLRGIDPAAQYDVEGRTTLKKEPIKIVSGRELAHF